MLSGFKDKRKPSIVFENRVVNCVNGKVCDFQWTINPNYDNRRRLIGFHSIGKDLTQQKKRMAAEFDTLKMESLDVLAGGIAHDYNNIMGAVIANIGSAKIDLKQGSSAFNSLSKAEALCVKTKYLCARMLSLFEVCEPNKTLISINNFFEGALGYLSEDDPISYTLSVPEDIAPVGFDVVQMKQAIANIVDNAREAMSGKGNIHVSCDSIDIGKNSELLIKEGKYAKISIKDHGKGIPPEIIGKVFDPYFSTKEMGHLKGVGLGLSISDAIVKKHGGCISAESQLGKGSTFSIYLPAAEKQG